MDKQIKKVNIAHNKYPSSLLDLADPPQELYYIGSLENINFEKSLAVVGSRRMTSYGRQVLDRLIPDLVSQGVVIISGFMYGVDTYAHQKCLEFGGKTVAVLANGLDICYPPENKKLFNKIIEGGGVVVSEYPKGSKPQLWTFPRRNRIVAALSLLGTLVIEAGADSGSLITAKLARKLKRKVYAVPGPITSSVSIGTNYILKNRLAKFVVSSSDIVEIEHKNGHKNNTPKLDGLEAKIYQTLMRENCTLDELSVILGEDITTLSSAVSLMALRGLVEETGGKLMIKS